jgi:hypothetical protein
VSDKRRRALDAAAAGWQLLGRRQLQGEALQALADSQAPLLPPAADGKAGDAAAAQVSPAA